MAHPLGMDFPTRKDDVEEFMARTSAMLHTHERHSASPLQQCAHRTCAENGKSVLRAQTLASAEPPPASYELEQSMWDAAVLLFCHRTAWTDKVILLIGMIVNSGLQIALLLTVYFDMLQNPYSSTKVKEMVHWRALKGHSYDDFDSDTGYSVINRLCQHKLWSFEQEEYQDMFEYLYMPMPGWTLSVLAIIMWVLTMMAEYRRCCEQGLALWHLPTLKRGDPAVLITEDGEQDEILGIYRVLRALALSIRVVGFLAFATLIIPRLFVTVCLCLVGCQYLAQTASLHDIVLNAVALAFVLDVDELLAQVLFTERIRMTLPRIKPLACGENKLLLGFPVKDLLRYVLTLGFVLAAVIGFLIPFSANVQAAALALCGGVHDFSFSGGHADSPPVVLQPKYTAMDEWTQSCTAPGDDYDSYLRDFYGFGVNESVASVHNSSFKDSVDYTAIKSLCWCYAFSLLKPDQSFLTVLWVQPTSRQGRGRSKTVVDNETRSCIAIPQALTENLPADVGVGTIFPSCPRFNASDKCKSPTTPDACIWSWRSIKCEQYEASPPGHVFARACAASTNQEECDMWRYQVGAPHPTKNCRVIDECGEDADCLEMLGSMDFEFRATACCCWLSLIQIQSLLPFLPLHETAPSNQALKTVMVAMHSLTADSVTIADFIRTFSGNLPQEDTFEARYRIHPVPMTLLTERLYQSASALRRFLNQQLTSNNITFNVTGIKFDQQSATFRDASERLSAQPSKAQVILASEPGLSTTIMAVAMALAALPEMLCARKAQGLRVKLCTRLNSSTQMPSEEHADCQRHFQEKKDALTREQEATRDIAVSFKQMLQDRKEAERLQAEIEEMAAARKQHEQELAVLLRHQAAEDAKSTQSPTGASPPVLTREMEQGLMFLKKALRREATPSLSESLRSADHDEDGQVTMAEIEEAMTKWQGCPIDSAEAAMIVFALCNKAGQAAERIRWPMVLDTLQRGGSELAMQSQVQLPPLRPLRWACLRSRMASEELSRQIQAISSFPEARLLFGGSLALADADVAGWVEAWQHLGSKELHARIPLEQAAMSHAALSAWSGRVRAAVAQHREELSKSFAVWRADMQLTQEQFRLICSRELEHDLSSEDVEDLLLFSLPSFPVDDHQEVIDGSSLLQQFGG
eukprot:s1436_g2.t1